MEAFDELVAGNGWFPVEDGALLIAKAFDPEVDLDRERGRLDDLAAQVREPTLDGLRHLLFDDLGFRGDQDDYYDPSNSLLPAVLDRRRGIPLSLAVVTIAVGRRVGVPLEGIGLPGHFLVGDRVDPTVFVDVFAGGRLLDREACAARLRDQNGVVEFDEDWLRPIGERAILIRWLLNLRVALERQGDSRQLAVVLYLSTRLALRGAYEARDIADRLVTLGRFDLAAAVHSRLVDIGEDDGDREQAAALLARLN
jgi:regulator of sirC expression with transglutaminase-like and TPR domain